MNAIVIRHADLENTESCSAILGLIGMYAQDPMGGSLPSLPPFVQENLIAGLKAHPTTRIFLAYSGEKAVGVAVCFLGFSTFAAKPLINIHDLAVEPGYRGQGIGMALLGAVENEARAMGCCKLTLEVLENNSRAVRTYKSFGFEAGHFAEKDGNMLFYVKPIPVADAFSGGDVDRAK
ncbi:MAG: GNAT family N-acetyltransferase [Fibrobacterota bacterium]|nr:GNAT family N-acetyltransferase [Fibrobacterota bacterium]